MYIFILIILHKLYDRYHIYGKYRHKHNYRHVYVRVCVCVANQERGGQQDLGRQGGKAGKRWWKWWGLAEGKDLLIRIIVP